MDRRNKLKQQSRFEKTYYQHNINHQSKMRVTSIILLLIAFAIHLSARRPAKVLYGKKINYTPDTTGKQHENAFLFASASTEDKSEELTFSRNAIKKIQEEGKTTRFLLGQSKQMRTIEAWFFPGTSDKNALVIGGVHGTELSSIEVANALIQKLLIGRTNYYNVIIIPCLFADNAATAKDNGGSIGSTANIGRYSFSTAADPNRQMPSPGQPFNEVTAKDHLGRVIEKENQLLLRLISLFKPDRIANIHAIREADHAGIYADPRTDSKGYALGFESDSSLAIEMASFVSNNGAYIPGNQINKKPTALYYKDPTPAIKGDFQKRNFNGSQLSSDRGSGITLGTWASTAISDAKDPMRNRNAMRILTIEFPGYKRPSDYSDIKQQDYFKKQVQLYASSIESIFLKEYFVEEDSMDNESIALKMK